LEGGLYCCKNGWYKDSIEIIGRQTRGKIKLKKKTERSRSRWMDDTESDFSTVGVKM